MGTATASLTTPKMLSPDNEIEIGSNNVFTIKRSRNTVGAGTDFIIAGQDSSATGTNGGDIKFVPGTGVTDGDVIIEAQGEAKLTVSGSAATIALPMYTANVDAGSYAITTTGTVTGGTVSATGSFTSPSFTAAT